MTFGADFAVLPFLAVVASVLGLSVTGPGAGLGGGEIAALTTRPPWTTWFQPGPRLFCSADGSRFAFLAVGGNGRNSRLTAFGRRPLSNRRLGLFAFHAAPVVGYVVSSTAASFKLARWSTPLRGEPHRKQHTGCIAAIPVAYGRSVGSVCSAWGLSGRCTFPPRHADDRVRSGKALSPLPVPAAPTQSAGYGVGFVGLLVAAARAEL